MSPILPITSSPTASLVDDITTYEIASDDEEAYVDAHGRRLYRMTTPPIRLAHRKLVPAAPAFIPPVQAQIARPVARGLNLNQQLLLDARKPRVLSRSDIHPPTHPSRVIEVPGIRRQPPPMSTAAFYHALGPPPSARARTPTRPAMRHPPSAMRVGHALPQPQQVPPRRSTVRFDSDDDFFTAPSATYNQVRYAREGVAGPSNEVFRQETHRGYRG